MKTKLFHKSSLVFSISLALSSMGLSTGARADAQAREVVDVPLTHVFIAREGFDDNDNVQAVVRGELPNSCYTVAQSGFSINARSLVILFTQTALLDRNGLCADPEKLPAELKQPIPFVREVNFGGLIAGSYRIDYDSTYGKAFQEFHVAVAPTASVDSSRYALITNAFVNEVVDSQTETLEFRISGYISSSCADLANVDVVKVDDVFVVLPKVELSSEFCLPVNKAFYKTITVPMPTAGHYLLHARSLAGQSANRVFLVK